jgi:hypothetical protein
VGRDAGDDGRVMPAEEAGDLEEAVAALGMVADTPPRLLSRARNSARTTGAAELLHENAAMRGDVLDELKEIAEAKVIDDGGDCPLRHQAFPVDVARLDAFFR